MYAVIESGGKQYRVELGQEIAVDRLDAQPGETIQIERVLLVADEEAAAVGRPTVAGARVSAAVVRQERGEKVVVFKYRPKARHRSKNGARAELTILRIADIEHEGRSAARLAEAARTERERLAAAAAEAAAQTAAADKALAAKLAREAEEARKAEAKKTAAKQAETKKTETKKTEAKKPEAKGAAAPKAGAKAAGKPAAKPEARAGRKPAARTQAPEPEAPPKRTRSTKKDE
jgi:large subunit ribosomal protein L21